MVLPTVIILEGNISAGKTSLARDLGNLLDYHVFLEPTVTNPYLEKFYADPPKYALVMQIWLLKQRFRIYISALKYVLETGRGVILDRSVFSDWVFAEKNRQDNNISEEGYQEYLTMRKMLLAHLPIPQITVYLDVSPQECYRRVHHLRGRDFEGGIPLGYLSGLDACYRSFMQMMEESGSKVISVPWNSFGNSNAVSQQIRTHALNLVPLDELVDVPQLTEYIYQNPFVLGVLAEEKKAEESKNKEQQYLDEEKKRSTPFSTPAKPISCSSSSSSPSLSSPSKLSSSPSPSSSSYPSSPQITPVKFSSSKPIPISPPLFAN